MEAVREVEAERDDDHDDDEHVFTPRYRFLTRIASSTSAAFSQRVDGLLESLVDVLPADDDDRVVAAAEELRDCLAHQPVALVLELAELDQRRLGVLEALELAIASSSFAAAR